MQYFKKSVPVIYVMIFFGFTTFAQQGSSYELVYEADKNGKVIMGSLEKLNDYVDKGHGVRVGWRMGKVFHWAEAMFITQHEGHVFAQIHAIFMQAPLPSSFNGSVEIQMPNKDPHGWSAILGTTGGLEMKWNGLSLEWDKEKHPTEKEFQEYVRSWEKGKAHTKWVVLK